MGSEERRKELNGDPGWEVRRYREGDETGINELFRRVFLRERSPEEWDWKFKAGPMGRLRFIHLACDRERIVGQMAGLPTKFLCHGRLVLAVQPVDNMLDPEYRGGLGKSRMQRALFQDGESAARESGVALGYGFPNPEAYRVGTRLLGYADLGAIAVRQRSLTWARHARKLTGNGWAAAGVGRIHSRVQRHALRPRVPLPPGAAVRQAECFDARFDRLWEQASASFGMLAVRDRRFLNWRYRERPGARYTVLTLERADNLLGYAVLASRGGEVRTGFVADLLCLPGEGLAEPLLAASILHFLEQGLDLAECWSLPGGRYEEPIRRYFPRQLAEPVRAVIKIYEGAVDRQEAANISNWHITMGDSDGV